MRPIRTLPPHVLAPLALALPGLSATLAYSAPPKPAPAPAAPVDAAFFRSKIASVLEQKCVSCHRPDNAKGSFDLTSRAAMLKGGDLGTALVPGKPDQSPLYTRTIAPKGQKPEMPEKGEPLTPEEAILLRRWIAAGAPWPEQLVLQERTKADRSWWAYRALSTSAPPQVKGIPAAWSRNPVDRFVFAKLREKGLTPNPPADPRALIRRATYDLHGLPSTPSEVEAFVKECRTDRQGAVARLVDRLLASPHYGERWGRHWLDVVRFGESNGFERNVLINNVWPYRDYVIRSFNEDKPFDRFVLEQLAGDVVGKGDPKVEIGTAFLVCGPYDNVGNQDAAAAAQIRANTLDDMIRATSEAFLGTTVGCARCHDHKFDPVLARDYYSLYATFAGVTHGDRTLTTPEQEAVRVAKLKPLEESRNKLAAELEALNRAVAERTKAKKEQFAARWTRPTIDRAGTEERFAPVEARALRLVVLRRDDQPEQNTGYRIDEFEVWTGGEKPRNVALAVNGTKAEGASRIAPDFAEAYSVNLTIDGRFGARWFAAGPTLTLTFARPERIERVFFSNNRNPVEQGARSPFVGDYRIEVSADGKTWKEVASSLDRKPLSDALRDRRLFEAEVTPAEQQKLAELRKEIGRLDGEIARLPQPPRWWIGHFNGAPGPFNVFVGGDPQKKGAPVVPASFSTLSEVSRGYQLAPETPEGERRVALARWITAPDNPLTPRVLANRVWHYHFGTGIVDTPSDFGYMGGRPTHPELLDYLARYLTGVRGQGSAVGNLNSTGGKRISGDGNAGTKVNGGKTPAPSPQPPAPHPWTLKALHRLIMTSETYQQSAAHREAAAKVDGDSRLLWRFPPRRLAAEEVRDTVLSIAGKLDKAMGGPGFRLYEYQEDNVATYVPLDKVGPETYRRSVYHQNARAARVDLLTDFDCPDPAFAVARRASTTTPLQALTLMNHSFSLDMAEALAERLQQEAPSGALGQVVRGFILAYARPPAQEELAACKRLVERHGLRAFCRTLLNSNELVYLQ